MRGKNKIQVVFTTCKRCDKQLAMTNHSINGADAAKKQYEGLCNSCVTNEEKAEILKAQAEAFRGRA